MATPTREGPSVDYFDMSSHGIVSIDSVSQFPLPKIHSDTLYQLGNVLWSWELCAECQRGKPCSVEEHCPSRRFKRLKRFFEYYQGTNRVATLSRSVLPSLDERENYCPLNWLCQLSMLRTSSVVSRASMEDTSCSHIELTAWPS